MTDKLPTLAEQIMALKFEPATNDVGRAINAAYDAAAAIADAAATTTPAEQAGDVGQAWRVKPLVWRKQSGLCEIADTPWGCAVVQDESHALAPKRWGWWMVGSGEDDSPSGYGIDIESAKSAAQADYADRITAALEPDPTPPTALSGPPKDGRMVCLLVDYSDGDHPLEDAKQAWTIGYNTLADTGDDEWLIAGWSWEQDCYTDGRGTVIGWLPFPCDTTPALGWRAMQTAAAQMLQAASAKCRENFTYPAKTKEQTGATIHANAATAILAMTGPTDAPAEQAGDVRVKLSGIWSSSENANHAALEPDPTPALGGKAMQTAAVKAVAKEAHGEAVLGGQRFKTVKLEDAVDAILALPGPTDAQLRDEAMKLPTMQSAFRILREVVSQVDQGGYDGKVFARDRCISGARALLKSLPTDREQEVKP